MNSEKSDSSRRKFLYLTGAASLIGLAGCVGGDTDGEVAARDPGWCIEENDGAVPDRLRTAESIDGIPRDPDDLSGREEAAYQCHPQGYQLCANCRFFIPDPTGKSIGACSIVEGGVRSQDWCALYQHTERLSEPPVQNPLDNPNSDVPPPAGTSQ